MLGSNTRRVYLPKRFTGHVLEGDFHNYQSIICYLYDPFHVVIGDEFCVISPPTFLSQTDSWNLFSLIW